MIGITSATKATLTLAAALFLTAQAASNTCEITNESTCSIDSVTTSTSDGSVLIYPGGDTRCAFDNYQDNVTTFSSSSSYFFQVFPAANQSKKKLLLFFQGGGVCVDKYTCNFALQCQLGANALISTQASITDMGIMNRSLAGNVFDDYNIVYLPYCTGDLFVGNKILAPFESQYNEALGNKQCLDKNQSMYLNGYNNTMAVLKWSLANYPDPEQIVIGGFSAGSLAAQLWSAHVAKAWNVESKLIKYQVLADSYVGVYPEFKNGASTLVNYFGGCGYIDFPQSIETACEANTATVIEMVESLMKQVSNARWLFIDSIADKTQRMFYELALQGIAGYPFTNILPANEFYGNLTEIIDAYSTFMDVLRFNVNSTQHVYLINNNYQTSMNMEGQLLGDVLKAWLSWGSASNGSSIAGSGDSVTPGQETKGAVGDAASSKHSSSSDSTAQTKGAPGSCH